VIPFTTVAMALAASVPMPDTVLVACRASHLVLRHHSDALLVVWERALWDWRARPYLEMSRWLDTLERESFLFLRTTLETRALCERVGRWSGNPFALRHEPGIGIDFDANGHLMHLERMIPHPDRLVRQHEHGRLLISRAANAGRDPARARSMPLTTTSSQSSPRLAAATTGH
jgi:hypothetical protein